MGYDIGDNYSILNNYAYSHKNSFMGTLDWLSTPIRSILGGRNVSIVSQTCDQPTTTAGRVALVFFAILVAPVGIIATACLIIKAAAFAHIWEQRIVKEQSKAVWDVLNQFNSAMQKEKLDEALSILQRNPVLAKRSDISNALFRVINVKINQGAPWQAVQGVMQLLNSAEIIELINHAVKTRIANELKTKSYNMSSTHIAEFIQVALQGKGVDVLQECYQKVLLDALKVIDQKDSVEVSFKMCLAYDLLQLLETSRGARAYIEAFAGFYNLKMKVSQQYDYFIEHPAFMRQIAQALNNMRTAAESIAAVVREMDKISAQSISAYDKCLAMRSVLETFCSQLRSNKYGCREDQIVLIQGWYQHMLCSIDGISHISKVEDIEAFCEQLQEDNKAKKALCETLLVLEDPSCNELEARLSVLRLKNRANLISFTLQISSKLLEHLLQAIRERAAAIAA